MAIIVIEGLSLTGKTTLCHQLIQHFSSQGRKCIYCHHGHLTDNSIGEAFYQKAISAYNSWAVEDAVRWSVLSLQQDYMAYLSNPSMYSDSELVFLDRHFTSQRAVAEHFKVDIEINFQRPLTYFEFLITARFEDRLARADKRKDNHSRLTDYTLSSSIIHADFDNLYKSHALSEGTPPEHIIDNSNFTAFQKMIPLIDKLLLGE